MRTLLEDVIFGDLANPMPMAKHMIGLSHYSVHYKTHGVGDIVVYGRRCLFTYFGGPRISARPSRTCSACTATASRLTILTR